MAELKWLDGYGGQSIDELIGLAAESRVDSIVVALEQALDQKSARLGDDALSDEERVVLAVEALEREVNNGGYDQFFLNTPKYAGVIEAALRRIGCSKTAEISVTAIETLEIAGPLTKEAVDQVMLEDDDDRSEILSGCDQEFYKSGEDIAGCLFEFVKKNRQAFKLD